MGQFGTHLSRGAIYYIAYRWNGREYRESTRSDGAPRGRTPAGEPGR